VVPVWLVSDHGLVGPCVLPAACYREPGERAGCGGLAAGGEATGDVGEYRGAVAESVVRSWRIQKWVDDIEGSRGPESGSAKGKEALADGSLVT